MCNYNPLVNFPSIDVDNYEFLPPVYEGSSLAFSFYAIFDFIMFILVLVLAVSVREWFTICGSMLKDTCDARGLVLIIDDSSFKYACTLVLNFSLSLF